MSKDSYNDKTIREYLLGLLPEAETDRLDELSVTEEEFAHDLTVAEHDLIDAYANLELTEEEHVAFQRQYSRSPHLVERVRFAQAFQSSFKAREHTERADTGDKTKVRSMSSPLSFFSLSNWNALRWWLVASSLLVFLVASWLIVQQLRERRQQTTDQAIGISSNSEGQGTNGQNPITNQQAGSSSAQVKTEQERATEPSTTPPANQPSPARAVAFVLTPQTRSVSRPAELRIPESTTTVALRLQLELSDTSYYRTILSEAASDRPIWQSGRTKRTTTSSGHVLYIRVPEALLKQKAYRIRVVGIYPNGTTETANEYFFRVVK